MHGPTSPRKHQVNRPFRLETQRLRLGAQMAEELFTLHAKTRACKPAQGIRQKSLGNDLYDLSVNHELARRRE
jgi:hypothetical protein